MAPERALSFDRGWRGLCIEKESEDYFRNVVA